MEVVGRWSGEPGDELAIFESGENLVIDISNRDGPGVILATNFCLPLDRLPELIQVLSNVSRRYEARVGHDADRG